MGKVIKWLCIVVGGIVVLVVLALLLIPLFVDVQHYKPQIEKQVSDATGRPFTLGGELSLSLFPWAGLSLSDLHLGNPAGFEQKDFVSVKSFEVRVKLLPLLSRDVQVKRFILEAPRIVLERGKDGRGNWQGMGKASKEVSPEAPKKEKPAEGEPLEGLPIKALAVGEFAITDGSVLWIDQLKGERREISAVTLRLEDVSLDRPMGVVFSALMDGQPLSLEGTLGPVGKEPGKGSVPVDISLKALKQVGISMKGKIVDAAVNAQFDLAFELASLSPRKLMETLGQPFPVQTADPAVLDRVALKAMVKGGPQQVSITDGVLDLDESKVKFSLKAKDFSKPDVAFDLDLDQIDVDRYLPPKTDKGPSEREKGGEAPEAKKKPDYRPLRRLLLDGLIRVGRVKAQGVKMEDLYLKVTGKNGLFHLDPLKVKLYEGDLSVKGALDVRQDTPKSDVELTAKAIQAGPLLKDLMEKDFLVGTLQSAVAISMVGDDAEGIKQTLNGKGEFRFTDGAIVGIDLAGMVRNVKATFGLAEKGAERPRTDFSELNAPFTITKGVVKTPNTTLLSPLLRVRASGETNLVKEDLDFRVEPKFVATLKGQGDATERAGLMVPVLVTGTFSAPKFRPDLKGMLDKGLKEGIPTPDELKKLLPLPGQSKEKGESTTLEEKAKGLLKGLPFGK
jgi:AsmA protein